MTTSRAVVVVVVVVAAASALVAKKCRQVLFLRPACRTTAMRQTAVLGMAMRKTKRAAQIVILVAVLLHAATSPSVEAIEGWR